MSLTLEAITKIYGTRTDAAAARLEAGESAEDIRAALGQVVALRDVTLDMADGETTVIMGLSGSGKSTLVRIINRLIEPTSGRVLLDGEDITALDAKGLMALRRDRMAMVFQHFALLPHRTVMDNAAYGLEIRGVPARDRRDTAARWLETVGLAGYEAALPRQLSGGMRQRVGLARALATDADILLMDEPFSALDPLIRREMQDLLIQLQAELKKTLVFITHDLDEALRLGDRIALLQAGALVQAGSPADLVLHPKPGYAETFVRDANRIRVLTAGHLAEPAPLVLHDTDRPFAALRDMSNADVTMAYVVDARGAPVGMITADDARRAADNAGTVLAQITTPMPVLPATMTLDRILRVLVTTDHPLPVVAGPDGGPMRGIVTRDAALRALADAQRPGETVG